MTEVQSLTDQFFIIKGSNLSSELKESILEDIMYMLRDTKQLTSEDPVYCSADSCDRWLGTEETNRNLRGLRFHLCKILDDTPFSREIVTENDYVLWTPK